MCEAVIEMGGLIDYSGLDQAFDETELAGHKKLLRLSSRKQVDWAALIVQLRVKCGASIGDIAEKTGIPKTTLVAIANDNGFSFGDRALALLDLYATNIGKDQIPLLGEHHEGFDLSDDE